MESQKPQNDEEITSQEVADAINNYNTNVAPYFVVNEEYEQMIARMDPVEKFKEFWRLPKDRKRHLLQTENVVKIMRKLLQYLAAKELSVKFKNGTFGANVAMTCLEDLENPMLLQVPKKPE